ncbi:peptide-N-glycosidase F-related protein [Aestuariibaculum sp. M13]|uniref:peptide-N-glycosidase F-related protein n=1 Tax=Aestuariibaculum sp. M13 TaxID=2967132 RepID=UPI002159C74E|nr:peptide-N-glycosidase F-related protein [Aestuariibaculum sp. M13]MCR8667174.1 peptide-N-glycosidase F-related protein [Aestuariibaculum sp. M13]
MKKLLIILLCLQAFGCKTSNQESQSTERQIFDQIIFYNGYGKTVDEPVAEHVIRLKNSSYVKQLTEDDLNAVSDRLNLQVTLHARCDNYDRLGHVGLNFVKKGKPYSKENVVITQEIARFVSPFMNKNKMPNSVDYLYEINNIGRLLNNKELRKTYDFWIQFDLFGTPDAAQKQVEGCEGRSDIYGGSMKLISSSKPYSNKVEKLVHLYSRDKLDNYKHTDVEGETIKFNEFVLDRPLKNARLYVITSNHGANKGGEEYIRREHVVYFDGEEIAKYTPGGESCEEYRVLNTQSNGIYGKKTKKPEDWARWNNWCPGNKIPIRIYDLGDLKTGKHQFKMDVPEAEFKDQKGYIPLTAYIQGEE